MSMTILTQYFYFYWEHPILLLFLLIGWQFLTALIFWILSHFNTVVTNGLYAGLSMMGAGISALEKKYNPKSHEHLYQPIILIAQDIGMLLFLLIFFFAFSSIVVKIFLFVASVLNFVMKLLPTVLMFGVGGIILFILFWVAVALFIGGL